MKIIKIQALKYKSQTNNNDRSSKFKTVKITAIHPISDWYGFVIRICNFDIVYDLSIVIWDFRVVYGKLNRFYLNYMELALKVSDTAAS